MKVRQIIQGVRNMSAGPTYSVSALAEQLHTMGVEIAVNAYDREPDDWKFRANLENTFTFAERLGLLSLKAISQLRRYSMECDILHFHGVWRSSNLSPLILPRNHKARIVWSPRGMLSPWSWNHHSLVKKPFWSLLQKNAINKTHCFHATAHPEYLDIRERALLQPVAIIPNGVPIPSLAHHITKRKSLVFLSRIHKKKGLELLFDAWSEIHPKYQDWDIKIAGPLDSSYATSLQDDVKTRALPRIYFLGQVLGDEKMELLATAGVFILPSYSENFGIAIAEALAHGTPVITTTETPWQGIIDNHCGWWVKADHDSIKKSIETALSTPLDQLSTMGASGRAWMRNDYSWSSVSSKMLLTYNWLIGLAERPDFVIEN